MVFLNLARSFLFFFFAVGSGVAPFPKASAKVGGWFFISKFWGKFFLIGAGGDGVRGWFAGGWGGIFFWGGARSRPLRFGRTELLFFGGGRGRAHWVRWGD